MAVVGLGLSACGAEFPPSKPVDACSLLTGDEVASILPGNDGGKPAGQENTPNVWVRSCNYFAEDSLVGLAIDGAYNSDGSDFLKMGFEAEGSGGTKESIDGVGDEAIFWTDEIESGITAKAKGRLVTLRALIDPPPGKTALVPLANRAIGRLH
jgi:hypothetical protein